MTKIYIILNTTYAGTCFGQYQGYISKKTSTSMQVGGGELGRSIINQNIHIWTWGVTEAHYIDKFFKPKTPGGELQMDLVGYSAVEEVWLKSSFLIFWSSSNGKRSRLMFNLSKFGHEVKVEKFLNARRKYLFLLSHNITCRFFQILHKFQFFKNWPKKNYIRG